MVRDFLQVSLVLAVDYLFMHWPQSRFPFLGRDLSLEFLRGVNILIVVQMGLARALPNVFARRVAATWSRRERDRFKV